VLSAGDFFGYDEHYYSITRKSRAIALTETKVVLISMEDLNFQAKEIPGVIETGLFIGYADRVLLYDEHGGIEAKSRMLRK